MADRIPTYVLLGARNMEGRGLFGDLPAELAGPHENVWVYNVATNLNDEALQLLVNNKSTSVFLGHGPEMSFGPAIRNANQGRRVLLIKTAVEQSAMFPSPGNFNDWSEENYATDNRLATDLKSTTVETGTADGGLAARGLTQDVRGFLLSLGHLDAALFESAVQFETRLRFFIDYFRNKQVADGRTTLAAEKIPFAVALLPRANVATSEPFIDTIRAAIESVAASDDFVFAIENDDLDLQTGSDLSSAGQVIQGQRMAAALAPFVSEGFHPIFGAPEPLAEVVSPTEYDEQYLQYQGQAVDLLPSGALWNRRRDTSMGKILGAIASEYARVDVRATNLTLEATPRTATQLLPDWERILGIPSPEKLPGFYLDLTDESGGASLMSAEAASPTFPIPLSLEDIEFTFSAIVRVSWLQVSGSNGWKNSAGGIGNAEHYVFGRLDNPSNKGIRILMEPDHGNTHDLGGGVLGPALSIRADIGNGVATTEYLIAGDDVGVLAGTFPILEALASVDGSELSKEWAQISVLYRGRNGPAGATSGSLQAWLGAIGSAPVLLGEIAIPAGDRMQHAAGTAPIRLGARDASAEPFVGDFDQTRVYDRALPGEELAALWNLGAPVSLHGSEDSIVWAWEFDAANGVPAITPDRIGTNAGDLTLESNAIVSTAPNFGLVAPLSPCPTTVSASNVLRRFEAVTKLAFQGLNAGQSIEFFTSLAQAVGFEVEIQEHLPFVAGSSAGDLISQGDWIFVWNVNAPEVSPIFFRSSESAAGEPLVENDGDALICTLETHKPAQTKVFVFFNLDYTGHAPWSGCSPSPVTMEFRAPRVLGTKA